MKISFKEDKQKCYISLPISGYDYEERLGYAENVERILENMGYDPVNPFDNGIDKNAPSEQHMKADFKMLLECDNIYLCKGWEKSRGCLAEFNLAANCGINVIIATELEVMGNGYTPENLNRWISLPL